MKQRSSIIGVKHSLEISGKAICASVIILYMLVLLFCIPIPKTRTKIRIVYSIYIIGLGILLCLRTSGDLGIYFLNLIFLNMCIIALIQFISFTLKTLRKFTKRKKSDNDDKWINTISICVIAMNIFFIIGLYVFLRYFDKMLSFPI